MKNLLIALSLSGFVYSAYACTNANTQQNITETTIVQAENNPEFADAKINAVYQSYIALKNALVANDNALGTSASKALVVAAKEAGLNLKNLNAVANAKNVDAKRAKFNELSLELVDVFKANKLAKGVVYKQYCPMANSNKGGFWLASEKKVRNPYYGDKMMSCGSVKEEIK
ncbi:hypothetical protein BCY91_08905 [Pelobium manganitolerans]|uniref:DUF3347 domain-containing protein n=1 Tax=Pelobium manganitolerans TaxID=1842495 RepID=A0A419S328_9SPHI|nr:DUF3347 domain-containing protein [Pelobium manganitolerans]RKD13684.1 hypothetical protein BCY91_08905 [Pelobium manganitolerans]